MGDVSLPRCLCIGSGATVCFVGNWKDLLGKLLGKRFVFDWLRRSNPYAEVDIIARSSMFSRFFPDESVLELGEYLFEDSVTRRPEGYAWDRDVWQEQLVSQQVATVIRESVVQTLSRGCNKSAEGCDSCPVHRAESSAGHRFTLRELYEAYARSPSFSDDALKTDCAGVSSDDCDFVKRYSTTMAVVEYCARGDVRFVIDYNYDTVVEEMLFEAIEADLISAPASTIEEIHIWTYGDPAESRTLKKSNQKVLSIEYHCGVAAGDVLNAMSENAIHFIHVHGVAASEELGRVTSQLVLSEHSYRIYQGSIFNWSSQMLQYLLSCFQVDAVGFSGTDSNFRFVISHLRKAGMRGVLRADASVIPGVRILKASKPYRDKIEKQIRCKLAEEKRRACDAADTAIDLSAYEALIKSLADYVKRLVEGYYHSSFGIEMLWVEDYHSIAKALHRASTAPGHDIKEAIAQSN